MFEGEFPPPRKFQTVAHDALRDGARAGHRRQCLMAPTGGGKTYLGLQVINETLKKGNRAMFICDRITLINQTSETADRYGLWNHGIIQGNNPRRDLDQPFQIASAQTLASWKKHHGEYPFVRIPGTNAPLLDPDGNPVPFANVIVVDECHTRHDGWLDYIETAGKNAMVIGLSATPFTKGMGLVFSHLINAATMDELTRLGVLVPMRIFSCRKPDMTGAKTNSKGEWAEEAAAEREMAIVGDVVTEWTKHALNLKTIIFGSTILHCEELAKQFNECGIKAAVFTANTKPDERTSILDEYRTHDSALRVLISVEALAKGFDVPDVECVCDCRPLRKSLSVAIQMWGRGLRSCTGKQECVLLDFSGNIVRFAEDFERVYYNGLERLDDGEKLDKEVRKDEEHEARPCPKCGNLPFAKKCMKCGYEAQPKSLIEHLPGTMQEIVLCDGRKLATDKLDLWHQIATYALDHARPGKDPHRRALALFHDITGEWPPTRLQAHQVPRVEPTRNTIGKIRSMCIAWAHRRAS